jgi:hypothetical protein
VLKMLLGALVGVIAAQAGSSVVGVTAAADVAAT